LKKINKQDPLVTIQRWKQTKRQ